MMGKMTLDFVGYCYRSNSIALFGFALQLLSFFSLDKKKKNYNNLFSVELIPFVKMVWYIYLLRHGLFKHLITVL